MKLFLTGELFDGNQAVEMGLAHRAVPADQLAAAVQEELDMLNLGSPNALKEAKRLVREVSAMTIKEGFEVAGPWSRELFESADGAEGMAAFREKRKPSWVISE